LRKTRHNNEQKRLGEETHGLFTSKYAANVACKMDVGRGSCVSELCKKLAHD